MIKSELVRILAFEQILFERSSSVAAMCCVLSQYRLSIGYPVSGIIQSVRVCEGL